MIKNQKKATMFALIAVAMWSTVASAFKITLDYFSPIQMLLVATCTTILLLTGICYRQKKLHLLTEYVAKRPFFYLLLGLINPCLYYLILFQAYDLLPAQQAQSLNYTWAITLSILAVPFLGQKLRKQDIIAIILAYSGALIIATKGDLLALDFSSPLGVFLALLSTLLWAMYWIINAKNSGDPLVSLLLGFLLGLPILVILTAIISDFNMPDWQGWAGAIYIGLFEMGFAFVAWLTALRYAENTSKISNLIFISPFVSLLLLNMIIDEPIYPATIVGLAFIIGGLLVQQLKKSSLSR
ncbi:DMT family transporter [Psychromonas sp. Urea-02u-13]|uniref:DMT family transporter n=1 Tax=Psychromonas sp. Urea-02u-13 TaxID=2058326 RepID=UPI000C326B64|nr:DMT family transporter [Psychromonas sp. Urea-02u-13]PKG37567.1 EamA family transporter [Psychromonas sp. Urea-02u-13]